jgi:hypothetical protein
MLKHKYGYSGVICGVYLITCKINNKKYVGASVNVLDRFSNHMNRDSRRYPHREMYKDVFKYGYENFDFEVLEECNKENLLEREQYYYDQILPEYNEFRPVENLFEDPDFRQFLVDANRKNKEMHKQRKELYNTPEYKKKFQTTDSRMRPIDMFDLSGNYIRSFISIRETARWITENTKFKGKGKPIKIKLVCDEERRQAYGYIFRYSKKSVETILKESRLVIDTQVEAVELSDDDNVK